MHPWLRRGGARRWLPPPGTPGVNLTPLLDVVLQLVIFFMLTSPLVATNVLPDVEPPESRHAAPAEADGDVVGIDERDGLTFNGAAMGWEDLEDRLRTARAPVTLMADARSSLGATVRAMDACRDAGVDVRVVAVPAPK